MSITWQFIYFHEYKVTCHRFCFDKGFNDHARLDVLKVEENNDFELIYNVIML